MTNINLPELTTELSLFDIYRKSRVVRPRKFNQVIMSLVILILAAYILLTAEAPHHIAERVRTLADLGLTLSVSILGFLIAGFTIFATITKTELFIALAAHQHKSGLSYLKYILFAFMDVFILYITFAAYCLLIKLFCSQGGPLTVVLHVLPSEIDILSMKEWLSKLGLVITGSWLFSLILTLKAFIFNIYHTLMTSIRWELEKK